MKAVEQAVEDAILAEFREIDRLGGVLAAVEHRYQRSQIQSAAHRYEQQIDDGDAPDHRPEPLPRRGEAHLEVPSSAPTRKKKQLQVDRLSKFKRRNARAAAKALDELSKVVEGGGNVFEQLIETVEHCSLGQITARLHEMVGHYRPTV